MSRAVRLAVAHAFRGRQDTHRMVALDGNLASLRVAHQCGFVLDAWVPGGAIARGEPVDAYRASLRAGDPLHPRTSWESTLADAARMREAHPGPGERTLETQSEYLRPGPANTSPSRPLPGARFGERSAPALHPVGEAGVGVEGAVDLIEPGGGAARPDLDEHRAQRRLDGQCVCGSAAQHQQDRHHIPQAGAAGELVEEQFQQPGVGGFEGGEAMIANRADWTFATASATPDRPNRRPGPSSDSSMVPVSPAQRLRQPLARRAGTRTRVSDCRPPLLFSQIQLLAHRSSVIAHRTHAHANACPSTPRSVVGEGLTRPSWRAGGYTMARAASTTSVCCALRYATSPMNAHVSAVSTTTRSG